MSPPSPTPARTPRRPLTHRQREVAELVAQGYTNKDICAETGLSRRRVETVIQDIGKKLLVDCRRNSRVLIALAMRERAA